jgi:hypothetical protein
MRPARISRVASLEFRPAADHRCGIARRHANGYDAAAFVPGIRVSGDCPGAQFRKSHMKKREAELNYYEGLRAAMEEHARVTEDGLRELEGVGEKKLAKLIEAVRERHQKLINELDRRIAAETKRAG